MQRKLDTYFSITPSTSPKKGDHKTCYIYDPENYRAYFTSKPDKNDQYLTKKVGVSLYYRPPRHQRSFLIPEMRTVAGVPLLKSNLQKAIRKGHILEALQSALAILQRDPMEFFRRLPIIYIEDVCLIDSFPIVVWLMMAEKEHTLDGMDIDILLQIIKQLCDCVDWYDDSVNYSTPMEISPSTLEHNDSVLALYYRSLYGGTKGDMAMLNNAIYYYLSQPKRILRAQYEEMDYDNIGSNVGILEESIDFHPFPGMLTLLSKQTSLESALIKEAIWYASSAINIRKPHTIKKAETHSSTAAWKAIQPFLSKVRRRMYSFSD